MSNDLDEQKQQKNDTSSNLPSTTSTSTSSSSISTMEESSLTNDSDLDLLIELTAALNLNLDIFKQENLIQSNENNNIYLNKENLLDFLKNQLNLNQNDIGNDDPIDEIRLNDSKTSLMFDDNLDKTNDFKSLFDSDNLPTNLLVKSLKNSLFTNNDLKAQFEQLFTGLQCKFCYLPSFRRCYIQFENPIAALIARIQLHKKIFLNEQLDLLLIKPIRMKNTRTLLEAPQVDKLFLISPPSSPPVGWEQEFEDPPVVNLDLLAALSKLEPHEPCELIKSKDNLPSIIVHPCPDLDMVIDTNLKRKFIPTRRPADDF